MFISQHLVLKSLQLVHFNWRLVDPIGQLKNLIYKILKIN